MVRVNGPLAAALQTSFIENWLETKGEILAEREDFPYCLAQDTEPAKGDTRGLVVTSAPSAGKATRARILFQVLLAAAGALLVHVLGHFGGIFLADKLPALVASPHWQHMAGLASHHGWWVLILVAALPVSQTPFLVVAALFGMPAVTIFLSLLAGKAVKYGAVAALTARAMSALASQNEALAAPIAKARP